MIKIGYKGFGGLAMKPVDSACLHFNIGYLVERRREESVEHLVEEVGSRLLSVHVPHRSGARVGHSDTP